MLKQQKQHETEDIVNLIERMIDLRYKMLIENQYNNYRQSLKIYEFEYNPTVEELKLKLEKIGIDFD
jgi:predicted transcriptional regulator